MQWISDGQMVKFYQTKEWRKLRAIARRRDHNECQRCKALGKYSKADMVHHKKEVKNYPELALTLNNLECECNPCHNVLHPEKFAKMQKKKFTNEERW